MSGGCIRSYPIVKMPNNGVVLVFSTSPMACGCVADRPQNPKPWPKRPVSLSGYGRMRGESLWVSLQPQGSGGLGFRGLGS